MADPTLTKLSLTHPWLKLIICNFREAKLSRVNRDPEVRNYRDTSGGPLEVILDDYTIKTYLYPYVHD